MKLIKTLMATILLAGSMAAQATIITVSGAGELDGDWDISFVRTSYTESQALLESQVWWGGDGQGTVAEIFAQALGYQAPRNFIPFTGITGPLFAFDTVDRFFGLVELVEVEAVQRRGGLADTEVLFNSVHNYAVATRVPAPATLLLLGVALLGMGLSRRAIR